MTAIRAGICVLVAFSVLAHGAVEAWSESVLEIGAAVLFVWWVLLGVLHRHIEVHWNPLIWPMVGFLGVGLLQYFVRLSVYPYLTKIELLKLSAYLLLSFLTVQAFRTIEHWRALVWFLLAFGFVVAVFGIIQHFTFNGKLYWVRELRYGGMPFGSYVNRNHFAGVMELIIPSGMALLVLRAVQSDQLLLVGLFTIVPIGAVFLSASRGGIITLMVELGLFTVLIWAGRAQRRNLVVGAMVVLLAAMLVAWLGVGPAMERFASFKAEEVSELGRLVIIKDSWRIFLDYPVFGTGLGTFIDVYPRYESFYDAKVVNHVHNEYVEALVETGVVGGTCCLLFIVGVFRSALAQLQSDREASVRAMRVGALVACAGLLVHSTVDFGLHIPSNATLFFLQAWLASSALGPLRLEGHSTASTRGNLYGIR